VHRRFSLRKPALCLANAVLQPFYQPEYQEFIMSSRNGDRSRFHRVRKQKIARRKRTHELLERGVTEAKSLNRPPAIATRSVPA